MATKVAREKTAKEVRQKVQTDQGEPEKDSRTWEANEKCIG